MPVAIRLKGFFGALPALNPRYLPDQNAQTAQNTRIWAGSLRPVNGLRAILPTTIPKPESIFQYASNTWFEWNEDVDVVRSPVPNDTFGRAYFSKESDGPWVTATAIATLSAAPYPGANKYRIGVPASATAPTGVPGGVGSITETRFYVYTVVNIWGEEGPPSPVSALVNLVTNTHVNVTLTAVVMTGYAAFSKYRVYRTNSIGTAFQLAGETAILSFVDNITVLTDELPSAEWDEPPINLKGLVMLPNGVIAGFRGNELRFSEPGLPHAWPADYIYQTDFPIVALATISNGVAALTQGEPYLFVGTHPGAMAGAKLENSYACMAKRGVARFGDNAVYPAASGLAVVSAAGVQLLTERIFDEKDWAEIRPTTFKAFNWRGRYVGFYTDENDLLQGFVFDPAAVESGIGTFYGLDFGGAYEDLGNADVYVSTTTSIAQWDGGAPQNYIWRSKPYELPAMRAMTWLQVRSDGYPVIVSVYRDGQLQDRVRLGNGEPQRIRNSRLGRSYELEIEGTEEVHEVVAAPTAMDLRLV